MLDETYHCTDAANPLYSMVRLEDIARLDERAGLTRVKNYRGGRCGKLYQTVLKRFDRGRIRGIYSLSYGNL